MKRRLFLVFLTVLFLCVNSSVVLAENRGGFFLLDNWGAPSGPSYITGGTVLLDWRDFEPIEGQYRWDLFELADKTYTGWVAAFNARVNNISSGPAPIPGAVFKGAYASGKKLRFKLRLTEGAIPLWLYGGEDENGKNPSSYGTICGYKNYDQVALEQPDCNPQTNIVIAITYPLYPTKEDNAEPVWWNPIFQEKLRKTIVAIGQRIENDPVLSSTIEFVEASLGSYGETILYGKSDTFTYNSPNQKMFRAAGYTNKVYSDAVQTNLASYYEGFKKLPIAVSLGSGLYSSPYDDGSGVLSVHQDFYPKIVARYGSRLYPKHAGFGPDCKGYVGQMFTQVCPDKARCIYESFGGIGQWEGFPWGGDYRRLESIFQCATLHKAYIVMMWTGDFKEINNSGNTELLQAFETFVPQLWALGATELPPPPNYDSLTPVPSSVVTPTPIPTIVVSPTVTRVPTNTSIPPSPTATSIPVVNINLVTGWNNIPWQNNYPTAKKFSDVPDACSIIELNSNGLWRIYVKSYGGENLNFERDKSYSIRCNTNTEWRI